MSQTRVVVVSFDTVDQSSSVNPDPITIQPGTTTLYFALQTLHRGEGPEASFEAVVEDTLITSAAPVDGCGQLWRAAIVNDPPPAEAESHLYSLVVLYLGQLYPYDPTVILQPPPIGS